MVSYSTRFPVEVRRPDHPEPIEQREVDLVFEVAELIWEPPPD